MTADTLFQKERQTYEQHKAELLADGEGKYVLIRGDELHGTYSTYDDAIQVGYERFGLEPFMVKQVEELERVHFLVLQRPCQS